MATRGLPTWPFLNESPDNLPEAERLILDAVRAWALRGSLAEAALILASAGVEGTALLLDPVLRELPGLHLACPLCPVVTRGEASLLLALSAVQHNGRGVALGLLHRLAPPLGAYRAMPALINLGLALRRGGVTLGSIL